MTPVIWGRGHCRGKSGGRKLGICEVQEAGDADLVQEEGGMENYQLLSWGHVRGVCPSAPETSGSLIPVRVS